MKKDLTIIEQKNYELIPSNISYRETNRRMKFFGFETGKHIKVEEVFYGFWKNKETGRWVYIYKPGTFGVRLVVRSVKNEDDKEGNASRYCCKWLELEMLAKGLSRI